MNGKPVEVVVVDDEVQITELLEIFIGTGPEPANVHAFNDSFKARDFIRTHPVDVIITDYKMPGLNGVQLLENAPAGAKKVLISGYVSEIAEDKLQKLSAQFFEKPVPMKALRQAVFNTTP